MPTRQAGEARHKLFRNLANKTSAVASNLVEAGNRMSDDEHVGHRQWVLEALRQYELPLTSYAHRITGNLESARDVVQDVFMKLCRAERHTIDGHLAQWLYTVCRRGSLDHRRKDKRMTPLSEPELAERTSSGPMPSDATEQADDLAAVMRALSVLPEPQQEVIRLKFQHGLSYKQIAAVTEQPVGNVGYLIHVGLKSVRAKLTQ